MHIKLGDLDIKKVENYRHSYSNALFTDVSKKIRETGSVQVYRLDNFLPYLTVSTSVRNITTAMFPDLLQCRCMLSIYKSGFNL